MFALDLGPTQGFKLVKFMQIHCFLISVLGNTNE